MPVFQCSLPLFKFKIVDFWLELQISKKESLHGIRIFSCLVFPDYCLNSIER